MPTPLPGIPGDPSQKNPYEHGTAEYYRWADEAGAKLAAEQQRRNREQVINLVQWASPTNNPAQYDLSKLYNQVLWEGLPRAEFDTAWRSQKGTALPTIEQEARIRPDLLVGTEYGRIPAGEYYQRLAAAGAYGPNPTPVWMLPVPENVKELSGLDDWRDPWAEVLAKNNQTATTVPSNTGIWEPGRKNPYTTDSGEWVPPDQSFKPPTPRPPSPRQKVWSGSDGSTYAALFQPEQKLEFKNGEWVAPEGVQVQKYAPGQSVTFAHAGAGPTPPPTPQPPAAPTTPPAIQIPEGLFSQLPKPLVQTAPQDRFAPPPQATQTTAAMPPPPKFEPPKPIQIPDLTQAQAQTPTANNLFATVNGLQNRGASTKPQTRGFYGDYY